MAPWLTVLKMAMPFIADVATKAIPAFTAPKQLPMAVDPTTAKQIAELQTAAVANAESCRTIAEKLQQTIQGVEAAAISLQKQQAQWRLLIAGATALSVLSIVFSVWALLS